MAAGHWVFKGEKEVHGVGEKFDEIRDEAQAVHDTAEQLKRVAEAATEEEKQAGERYKC